MGNEISVFSEMDFDYMKQARKNAGEKPVMAMFQFSPVAYNINTDIERNEGIKKLTGILDKYGVEWTVVDTVAGSFNLDREWVEAKAIPCYIEYCGVYPVDWKSEDICEMVKLEEEGQVIIKVMLVKVDEDGYKRYIPNN